jgi:hypothetical protein
MAKAARFEFRVSDRVRERFEADVDPDDARECSRLLADRALGSGEQRAKCSLVTWGGSGRNVRRVYRL